MKRFFVIVAAASAIVSAAAQTSLDEIRETPGKAGGIYYAYPVGGKTGNEPGITPTAAPKGYKPFYVSHYGRHGSRYLISDKDYSNVAALFHRADSVGALTPLGRDVMARLDSVYLEAQGRGGELTPLGVRQHRGIAHRLYDNYPAVFEGDNVDVTAASTTVMRCAHSMFSFIEGLKERRPDLQVSRESSNRNMYYLNYHSPESGPYSNEHGEWYLDWKKFRNEMTQPDRLVDSLFADSLFVRRNVDPVELMWGLYWVAVDMQNMETQVDFLDLFTPEELFNLWQVFNFNFYACNSSYPGAKGLHVDNAKNLVNNIITTADEYIAGNRNGATLRFGHDGNLIPLAALLRLESVSGDPAEPRTTYAGEDNPYKLCEVYSDYKISPMAGNLQIIFFKNKAGDVLVKFLLNEREMAIPVPTDNFPFYRWADARAWLERAATVPFAEVE